MKKLALLSILLSLPAFLLAQSYVYTPMQASYENESFFYQPVQLEPSNIGPLSQILPGFQTSNPLNQLAQNPAWLPGLNGRDLYAYANVQSRNLYKADGNPKFYNPCPYCAYTNTGATDFIGVPDAYNPYFNANGNRLNQRPFLSAALVGYPFANKRIFAGITYQGIFFKEDYYSYPSFSYPAGSSYSDLATGAANPSVFFQQKNSLKQTGHFLTLLGGYKISEKASLGLQMGATFFQRDGGYGNPTYNYPGPSVDPPSIGTNPTNLLTEQRTQHYRHLSFDLGGRYVISKKFTGMAHLGYLVGSGNENLNISSPYYNKYTPGGASNFYYINQNITTALDTWSNSGHAFNGGLSLLYNLSVNSQLSFFYDGYTDYVGLVPSARLQSYAYTIQQYTDGTVNISPPSQLSSLHSGDGSQNIWQHDLSLFYEWSPIPMITINLGTQYGRYRRSVHTRETNIIRGTSFYQSSSSSGTVKTYSQPINSQQNIDWHNLFHEHSFQFPFIAQIHLFDRIELWGGFNEQIESIREKDNIISPNPVYYYPLETVNTSSTNTIGDPVQYMKYHFIRYRFTLLAGINFDITNRLTLHLSALPLDHRYSYDTTTQTSGLIWQAGISFYP
ncbi:MAG TPA: hypothetical protein VKA08_13440 [Balneolales bacterium]|nr:hypothetical protein [Balneolales bacterium]